MKGTKVMRLRAKPSNRSTNDTMNSATKRPQTKPHAQALNGRFFAFILLSLVGFILASTLNAQQPDKGQRERLKEQLQYGAAHNH
jgi:hypothetical protein